jgi:hypothetical protein
MKLVGLKVAGALASTHSVLKCFVLGVAAGMSMSFCELHMVATWLLLWHTPSSHASSCGSWAAAGMTYSWWRHG